MEAQRGQNKAPGPLEQFVICPTSWDLNPGPRDNKVLAADPSLCPPCMTINTALKPERRPLCCHTSQDVAIRTAYKMASLSAESITDHALTEVQP